MGFITREHLQAFCSTNNFLTTGTEPGGLDEAITQADGIISTYTSIAIPADPEDADPFLRNISCALVTWFTTGYQDNITEQEMNRRKKLFNDAMAELRKISEGKLNISSADDNSNTPAFVSTQRIDEAM